jgi:hypothetical protein
MANSAISMYDLSLEQCVKAISAGGNKRTVIAQGHMGIGKTAMLQMLQDLYPDHVACYFDCTTKDIGDTQIPVVLKTLDGQDYVRFATNEEYGLHLKDTKLILMLDELAKCLPSVFNANLRLIYERKMGSYTMHPESILFATCNHGTEGIGDMLPPHGLNRCTHVRIRKSMNMEWIENFAINNNVHPIVMACAKDNPHWFHSYEDVSNPDDNPYIFHPQATQTAFITGRSLESASDWLHLRDQFDDVTLTSLLIGTIGERGAKDMMANIKLFDQMPSLDSIKNDPKNALVPTSASATVLVVYRTLANLDKDWINAWMEYLLRLDAEAQGLFANGVRSEKYAKRNLVMTNKKFTEWATVNNYMFVADKA